MPKGYKVPGSGRKKGSLNKATVFGTKIISELLASYQESGRMSEDWIALDAKDRLLIAEKLMAYIIPKRQAISGDINVQEHKTSLDETLISLSVMCEEK